MTSGLGAEIGNVLLRSMLRLVPLLADPKAVARVVPGLATSSSRRRPWRHVPVEPEAFGTTTRVDRCLSGTVDTAIAVENRVY
jgi:hypothetical protein